MKETKRGYGLSFTAVTFPQNNLEAKQSLSIFALAMQNIKKYTKVTKTRSAQGEG
jgi:hypothetical protein